MTSRRVSYSSEGHGKIVSRSTPSASGATVPELSVIMPVHDGAEHLSAALSALERSDLPRTQWELIVVIDGDAEEQALLAGRRADVVVRLNGNSHGPAYARNRGAEVARAELLVFVDADACLHADALRRFATAFRDTPDLVALSGTYDTGPFRAGFAARFRNHYDYYRARAPEPGVFATACGAVRRAHFYECGMFDEWRFDTPQVEDREFGWRLHRIGFDVRVEQHILATHLKRWTISSVLRADLRARGVPWLRVLIQQRGATQVIREAMSRPDAWSLVLTWLTLAALPFAIALPPYGGVAAAAIFTGALASDSGLYRFFLARCGILFTVCAIPLQVGRHVVAGTAFLCAAGLDLLVGEPQRDPAIAAWSEVGLTTWPPIPAKRPDLALGEKGGS